MGSPRRREAVEALTISSGRKSRCLPGCFEIKAKGLMPGNNAQQTRRDSASFLASAAADQVSFTLCFPADYSPNGELTIRRPSLECKPPGSR
jgi:hypothetical protein